MSSARPRAGWLIVAACGVLTGCMAQIQPPALGPAAPADLRYLALGDSYTIGESVDARLRWPAQLVGRLRERGVAVAPPVIVAQTGWTAQELARAIDRQAPRGPFQLVSLQIGVNNQYRGLDVEEYRVALRSLLQRAIGLAGGDAGRLLVVSIPDWGVTPFAKGRDRDQIAAEIERFSEVNRAEAERAGARYIDITPQSRIAAAEPAMIAEDGLHPSGVMYAEWARLIEPAALAALAERGVVVR